MIHKRYTLYIAFAVIVLGVAIATCSVRWSVWFYNPPEPPYVADTVPHRLLLTFASDNTSRRTISWQCGSVVTDGTLCYTRIGSGDTISIAAEATQITTEGGTCVCYCATTDTLQPHADYNYCVHNGNLQSAWHTFSCAIDTFFSFIYVGDVQDTLAGTARQLFAGMHSRFPQVHFWLFGGDVVERPHDQYWNEFFAATDTIAAVQPMLACTGNHEYYKGLSHRLAPRFKYVFAHYADRAPETEACIRFDHGRATLYIIDSNRNLMGLFRQRRWLCRELRHTDTVQWKIVVLHHPPLSIRSRWNNLVVRLLLKPLLDKYAVDLVLSGHEHAYARRTTDGHTPLYLISQASPKDYRINFESNSYERYGNGCRFYEIVTVAKDSLIIDTYNEHHRLYDHLAIDGDGYVSSPFNGQKEEIGINDQRLYITGTKRAAYELAIEKHKSAFRAHD